MIGKNPFELGKKNIDLALGMGPYFGPMRALEKCLHLYLCYKQATPVFDFQLKKHIKNY